MKLITNEIKELSQNTQLLETRNTMGIHSNVPSSVSYVNERQKHKRSLLKKQATIIKNVKLINFAQD